MQAATERRLLPLGLAVALAIQAAAEVFFLADAGDDLANDPSGLHPWTESLVALALALGVILVGRALVVTLRQDRDRRSALALAAGEFRRVVEAQFDLWQLTKAERAVALLSLRGHEMERIAELRKAAPGTVRAQLARIYAKSDTVNRAQLSAVFVGMLLSGEGPPDQP